MSNLEKGIIVFGSFIIISAVIGATMAIKFPEIPTVPAGLVIGGILAIPHIFWYEMWKDKEPL